MAWTWENTLTYNFEKNGHAFDAVIGQSMEKWGIGETVEAKNANSLFPGLFDYAYLSNTQGISSSLTTVSGAPQNASPQIKHEVSSEINLKHVSLTLLCLSRMQSLSRVRSLTTRPAEGLSKLAVLIIQLRAATISRRTSQHLLRTIRNP